jgi:thiamine pyridinylase
MTRPKCLAPLLLLLLLACTASTQEKVTVRAALFPYLPPDRHNEALHQRITSEFHKANPDLKLELRRFDSWENFYDPHFLTKLLRGADRYDIIEVDTVLLGTLLDLELVAPWPAPLTDAQPIARDAARVDGITYGMPHWLCGHFVMSTHQKVAAAENASQLVAALEAAAPGTRNLAANLRGSWNGPALYLDAWADSRSSNDLLGAIRLPLDTDVAGLLAQVAAQGAFQGVNPCINGDYKDNDQAAIDFGTGKADALLGYSERMHHAVAAGIDPTKVFVGSAPLGAGSDPIWFVDMFVLPGDYPDGVTPEEIKARREAARRFGEFMNRADVFAWIHQSADLGAKAAPRYLLPATRSAYEHPALARDPIIGQVRPLVGRGTFFPRFRLPGARKQMEAAVNRAIGAK